MIWVHEINLNSLKMFPLVSVYSILLMFQEIKFSSVGNMLEASPNSIIRTFLWLLA